MDIMYNWAQHCLCQLHCAGLIIFPTPRLSLTGPALMCRTARQAMGA